MGQEPVNTELGGPWISSRDLSAWYEPGTAGGTFTINVHRLALDLLREKATESRHAQFRDELRLPSFIPPTQERWGYGEVLTVTSHEGDWTKFSCELPIFWKKEDEYPDRYPSIAVCATLSVLFDYLRVFEGNTGSSKKQLLGVTSILVRLDGLSGFGLGISLSPTVCSWLIKQLEGSETKELGEVSAAMMSAYSHMNPHRDFPNYSYDFMVHLNEPNRLHLSCPGDACGLDPAEFYNDGPEYGYELLPHNMDSPLQQLTLLFGIAKLHEMARREGV